MSTAKSREWWAKPENKERHKELCRKWRAKYPERYRQTNKNWYAKHPGYAAAKTKKWRAKHPGYSTVKRRERQKLNPAKHLLTHYKYWAKIRKKSFSLTLSWIEKKLIAGICERSGVRFICEMGNRDLLGGRNPWYPSIDRIDSSLGYTENNCQMVITLYNFAKNEWTDADVLKMAKGLVAKTAKK